VGFNGARNDKLFGVLHETIEKDKGKEFVFKGFKSPPFVNAKDAKVNILHMIFNLKGVLVGKKYFKINHLLPPLFNIVWGCTLLGKNIISRPTLKEFLLRCLEQFTIYIWMFALFANMNAYLRKIVKDLGIEINLQRIIGQDLCKINKHFPQFPFKIDFNLVDCLTSDKTIYHKNLSNFFPRYHNIHLGKNKLSKFSLVFFSSISFLNFPNLLIYMVFEF
jgi:hypothetical protein